MERQLEPIERAVLAAAGDAQAETRATGRALFAAFSRAWPAAGAATLGRLANRDRQLADKLARAVAEGAGGWGCRVIKCVICLLYECSGGCG